MTEQELQAIEARERAATPGPWNGVGKGFETYIEARNSTVVTSAYIDDEDVAFVVHARSDVPALLAEVRRLQGLIKQAEWKRGQFGDLCPWCFGLEVNGHKAACPAFGSAT